LVIGASVGGVEAITQLARSLPADLSYAVLIALHMPATAPSALARIVDRVGPLTAVAATDGEAPRPATFTSRCRIVICSSTTIAWCCRRADRERSSPRDQCAVRSAALSFGQRAIGILLSGVLDDGVLGTAAIRSRGGITVVQRPSEALFPEALGPPSGYTCPDCNGSLMTVSESNFRCRVGHAWTAEVLLKARDGGLGARLSEVNSVMGEPGEE